MPEPALPPADALLCERCGYAIPGLSESTPCPECGTPAGESWPRSRPGSRFQQRAPGGWFSTNTDILFSPRRAFRRVRIDPGSASRLLDVNVSVGAGLYMAGLVSFKDQWLMEMFIGLVLLYAAMLLLTYIETLGLRFFARAQSRRWRITADVAWTICHHASIGWLVGGLAMVAAIIVDPAERLARWDAANQLAKNLLGAPFSALVPELHTLQTAVPIFIGMLSFETLVYLGTRQCRYANTPAAAAQQGPGAPAGADRRSASA